MGVMRENMAMLAERDSKLHNLQDKSDVLQGTSSSFSQQAKRLRWEQRWQQYRVCIAAMTVCCWLAGFGLFRHAKVAYFAVSSAALVAVYLLQRFIMKRSR